MIHDWPDEVTQLAFLWVVTNVVTVTVLRDIQERGRELEQVLTQYTQFVKPAFEEFCLPVSDLIT